LPRHEDLKRAHVASLTYRLKSVDPLLDFTGTPFPKDVELEHFSCRVDGEELTATPAQHFEEPEDRPPPSRNVYRRGSPTES